jgi:UMF1 family MFS transporter
MAFYLPFIQSLSKNHSREFVASLGLATGQFGNIVGLVIAFALVASKLNILGLTNIPLVFCAGAILFLIGFIIFNKKFLEEEYSHEPLSHFLPRSFKEMIHQLASLRHEPNVLWYLITYYLFADAILTLQLFASLYLDKVGHMSSGLKTIAFVIGLLTAVIGALITPWMSKKIGNLKKAAGITILVWTALLVALALAQSPIQMTVMFGLNGFAFGILFSLSRIIYSKIIPAHEPAKYFGIYVLFERLASIIGPLVWSLSTILFAFAGDENKYRFAIGALAVLVLLSYFTLQKVKEDYRS